MRQAPSGQRINTDSCSFAGLIGEGLNPIRILDIGTGTGVVALMLAKRFADAEILAVEPELSTLAIARENFQKSPWSNRLSVLGKRAQDLEAVDLGFFDFIACNPPYFHQIMPSADLLRNMARHTGTFHPRDVYQSFVRLLTAEGSAWLSCPSESLKNWVGWGEESGLHVCTEIQIHDHPQATPHITILGWKRSENNSPHIEHVYYRTGPSGGESEWMLNFRDDWYPQRFNRR